MKIYHVAGASPESNLVYANLGRRLKAFLFDYAIILAYIVLLGGLNYGFILSRGLLEDISPFFASPWVKDGLAFLTLILPVILYFTFMESSARRGTVGKRKVGLMVVTADGKGLTKWQAFFRNLLKFLPWQVAHTAIYQTIALSPGEAPTIFHTLGFVVSYLLVGTYLASTLFSKTNRALYDWVVGSYVISA